MPPSQASTRAAIPRHCPSLEATDWQVLLHTDPVAEQRPAAQRGATRVVIQGTGGFTYRVYTNPKYGRLQYQFQYSYLVRNAWTGIGGAPTATNNMVFTGMRYYIP